MPNPDPIPNPITNLTPNQVLGGPPQAVLEEVHRLYRVSVRYLPLALPLPPPLPLPLTLTLSLTLPLPLPLTLTPAGLGHL